MPRHDLSFPLLYTYLIIDHSACLYPIRLWKLVLKGDWLNTMDYYPIQWDHRISEDPASSTSIKGEALYLQVRVPTQKPTQNE